MYIVKDDENNRTVDNTKEVDELSNQSDNLEYPLAAVIAYVEKGWVYKLKSENYSVVKKGIIFPKKIKNNSSQTIGLTAPWVKKTIIYSELITFQMVKSVLNVNGSSFSDIPGSDGNNLDIEVAPIVTFIVTDTEKFYDKFCSKKADGEITTSKNDFALVYSELENVLAQIVKECKFEYIKGFNYSAKTKVLNDIHKKMTLSFADIEEEYGIKITKFVINDANLPESIQKRADELAYQARENESLKQKADANRYVKEQEALGEAARLYHVREVLKDLPADKVAEVIRTLSLPEGTININGSNDYLCALLANEQAKKNIKNNDGEYSSMKR